MLLFFGEIRLKIFMSDQKNHGCNALIEHSFFFQRDRITTLYASDKKEAVDQVKVEYRPETLILDRFFFAGNFFRLTDSGKCALVSVSVRVKT